MEKTIYAGITAGIPLSALSPFDRLDRREIFRHWVKHERLQGFEFETIYTGYTGGLGGQRQRYRFQCQESAQKPAESHRLDFRTSQKGIFLL